MKKISWIIPVIFFIFVMGCSQTSVAEEITASPAPPDSTEPTPTAARTGVTILAEGIVQAGQPALPLVFETGGKLLAVHVSAGDQVQAGDLIATLDDTDLQEALTQARLEAAQAENNLAQAQQTLDQLEIDLPLRQAEARQALAAAQESVRTAEFQLNSLGAPATEAAITAAQSDVTLAAQALERAENDYAPYRDKPDGNLNKAYFGAVWADAQQAYDAAVRRLNALTGSPSDLTREQKEADLAVAQAQLAQAQMNLDKLLGGEPDQLAQLDVDRARIALEQSKLILSQAESALADAQLLAPWPGTVISAEVAPGALVGGGTPIVTLLDTTKLEFLTTNLSERDLAQISPGQTAVVTLKAYPDDPIDATVARIGWQPGEPVGDAATFPVILVLNSNGLELRPGMTGQVELRGEGQ